MSKRKRKAAPVNDGSNASSPKIPKGDIIRLLALIATVAGVYGAYKFFLSAFEDYTLHILIIYSVLATVSTLTYVIYNRGFSRRGLTPEMLPDTMLEEEKQEFIEDGEQRLRRSRPLLMVVLAFAFTCVAELVELIALPFLLGVFQ